MLYSRMKAAALLTVSTTASLVNGLGQQPIIAFNSTEDSFQIAGGSISKGQILVSSNDYWGVIRAAGDLALDFGRVTGTNYTLSNGVNGSAPASYVYHPVNNKNNTVVSSASLFRSSGTWRDNRLKHGSTQQLEPPNSRVTTIPILRQLMLLSLPVLLDIPISSTISSLLGRSTFQPSRVNGNLSQANWSRILLLGPLRL